MVILVAFGVLTGIDAPRINANLPTPWIGVRERINIGVYMFWVVMLSIALLRGRAPLRVGPHPFDPPEFQCANLTHGAQDAVKSVGRLPSICLMIMIVTRRE